MGNYLEPTSLLGRGHYIRFMCYSCSYTYDDGRNGIECLNKPGALGPRYTVKCGNHCITAEQWDIRHKRINSFFRGCSPNIGNKCTPDVWHISCVTSCRGDYCNRDLFVDTKNPPVMNTCKDFYGCSDGVTRMTSQYSIAFVCVLLVNILYFAWC
ncbi:uncharacterized protein LOC121385693 [Gigantopelta aegis]|uniref:uncharacterized protein LOC121385693 n=1 Tax=Gigantopelta aegis TaxID=1735272 RepID=UPI001B88A0C1|nr:uncharacterized protein LOC121385693 [Gigantopelta aegis]XP_041372399.1 uncharacterized protein LOC121385693 [Gigantopelta aegis]